MILTYKIRHNADLSDELSKARLVALYALKSKSRTSKDVKHLGLKSVISNQILKKYSGNKKLKRINSVKLTIPSQGIKLDQENRRISISSIKLVLSYLFKNEFTKINQIELDREFAYISVTVGEQKQITVTDYIGIDRNATSHIAVCALPNGKVLKLGKKAQFTHNKYKGIRKRLQRIKQFGKLKDSKRKEANIIRDLNHKISSKIVQVAMDNGIGIKLEQLKGIRKTKKQARSFKGTLHSWSFYQLEQFIEYKAKLLGVPVVYINPQYTSQRCHKCGVIGNRTKKEFYCQCGVVEHADVNAAFNIAKASPVESGSVVKLNIDGDIFNGNTDIPKQALQETLAS
jgi:putative transposase